ncbi:MAG: diguanylate cyclase domain-containing protein [Acidimicrobiales bacterium]
MEDDQRSGDEWRRRLTDRIIATSPLLYWVIDADSRIAFANEASGHLLGYRPDELIGRPATELVHTEDLATALAALGQIVESGSGLRPGDVPPMAMRIRCRDGSLTHLDVGAVVALDDPEVGGIIIRGRPMNGQQMLDQALESLVASSPLDDVLMYLEAGLAADLPGSLVSVAHEWQGDHFAMAVSSTVEGVLRGAGPDADPDRHAPWTAAVARRRTLIHPDLSDLPDPVRVAAEEAGLAACWVSPVFVPPDDAMVACVIVWRTIAGAPWVSQQVSVERTSQLTSLALARRHAENLLVHAARHDNLTGIPNRSVFFARLEQLASGAGGTGPAGDGGVDGDGTGDGTRHSAVLYLDLDGFKQVNDTHGHGAGDELLRLASERITACVRPGDLVARLGGDEFAVVCTDLAGTDEAETIAGRLVEAMAQPFTVDGHEVRVGLSVGVALAEPGRQGESVTRLVEVADRALYDAKQAGKGRYRVAR